MLGGQARGCSRPIAAGGSAPLKPATQRSRRAFVPHQCAGTAKPTEEHRFGGKRCAAMTDPELRAQSFEIAWRYLDQSGLLTGAQGFRPLHPEPDRSHDAARRATQIAVVERRDRCLSAAACTRERLIDPVELSFKECALARFALAIRAWRTKRSRTVNKQKAPEGAQEFQAASDFGTASAFTDSLTTSPSTAPTYFVSM